jgi:hypothetical protein
MSVITVLSATTLYTLSLLADGCILVAIALAATYGGRPLLWGGAFASFHALYAAAGIVASGTIADSSEFFGDLLAFIGSLLLLRHFMHHRVHHIQQGDCSCEHHPHFALAPTKIISTAAALSLHSLAAGAILQKVLGPTPATAVALILLGGSVVVGALIALVVRLGDTERLLIVKRLDRIPGVVTAALAGVCCVTLYHVVFNLVEPSPPLTITFSGVAAVVSLTLGYLTHGRGGVVGGRNQPSSQTQTPVQISSRR